MLRELLDSLAASVSLGLQRGVPLSAYAEQLALAQFESVGWTDSQVVNAHCVVDYVARWLELKFPGTGAVDQLAQATDGETCTVCGSPITLNRGAQCQDCGYIALPMARSAFRVAGSPP